MSNEETHLEQILTVEMRPEPSVARSLKSEGASRHWLAERERVSWDREPGLRLATYSRNILVSIAT